MQGKRKDQIEIVSEVPLDLDTVKKLKAVLADKFELEIKVDRTRFKEKVEVTSASPLDEETLKSIKAKFGEDAQITTVIDESVIGGIKIRTRDKLYDGTIQGKLNKLKNNL